MPFKANWEKVSSELQLSNHLIERMVLTVYPDKKLQSYTVFPGGCANLNSKVLLVGDGPPLILRVYLRDQDARYKEQKLGALLSKNIPVPVTYYVGEVDGYYFAFTQYMRGISLRDLLLSDTPHNLGALMYDAGIVLSRIAAHEFPVPGFFDKDLEVIHITSSAELLSYARVLWENEIVVAVLTPQRIDHIKFYLETHTSFIPADTEKQLVHGDFDPANILVDYIDECWKVSAVLDWEFAFSGSVLWDIANMLRYAHKMPAEFKREFLNGLTSNGIVLPKDWNITVHLLNLMSLSDCLARSVPERHPNTCADILDLIDFILNELDTKHRQDSYYEF